MNNLTEKQLEWITWCKEQGITIQINSDTEATITQTASPFAKLYTQKELYEMARAILPTHRIKAHVLYIELDMITPEWVNEQMARSGIKIRDLTRQTGLNRTTLEGLLSGKKVMSKTVQSLFYHYFKVYELSKRLDENGKEV